MGLTIDNSGVHNAQIMHVLTRADGRVEIHYMLLRSGVWFDLPPLCTFHVMGDPTGRPMTPDMGDPAHTRMPIHTPSPGFVGIWVWDAKADSISNINSVLMRVSFLDLLCCDEIEDEPWEGEPDPPPPTTPGIPQDPGDPFDPSNPGDPHDPSDPGDPGDPNDPEPGELPPWFGPGDAVPTDIDRYSTPVNPDPTTLNEEEPIRDPAFQPYDPLNPEVGVFTDFQPYDPNTPELDEPTGPISFGSGRPMLEPPTEADGIISTRVDQEGYERRLEEYPRVHDVGWLHDMSHHVDEHLIARSYSSWEMMDMARHETGEDRQMVMTIIYNDLPHSYGENIYWMAIALKPDSQAEGFMVRPPALLQTRPPALLRQPPPPPGTIPPGPSGGPTICLQFPDIHQLIPVLIVFMDAAMNPFMVSKTSFTPVFHMQPPPGNLPPPPGNPGSVSYAQDPLGEIVRREADFPMGILPEYAGTYHAHGDVDSCVFYATRQKPAIVVTTTAEAIQSGFEPTLEIYDANDMVNPVVVHPWRFRDPYDRKDLSPSTHVIGWRDDYDDLQEGFKYVAVVKHKSPLYYSRRWAYDIYHAETRVEVGGEFRRDDDGFLQGQLSCSYALQSLMLINTRTGEHVYVKTNDIGVVYDLQVKSHGGSEPNSKRLSVQWGDEIEIVRPGHYLRYSRDVDLIGQTFVQGGIL